MIEEKKEELISVIMEPVIEFSSEPIQEPKDSSESRTMRSNKVSPALFSSNGFHSRGSIMLRAALSDHNQQVNKKIFPSERSKQGIYYITPLKALSNDDKRKHRKEVAFADPIVSKQFIYDPEPEDFSDASSQSESSSSTDSVDCSPVARSTRIMRRTYRNSPHSKPAYERSRLMQDRKSTSSNNISPDIHRSPRGPKKRARDDSDNDDSACYYDTEVSLFSSPKVARVTPYDQDSKNMLPVRRMVPPFQCSEQVNNQDSEEENTGGTLFWGVRNFISRTARAIRIVLSSECRFLSNLEIGI